MKKKVIIMGAAGRDFHNFNLYFRDNDNYDVVAFKDKKIPEIDRRKYPAELAGKLYPEGIPIHAEEEIIDLIQKHDADEVVFAYSDVPHERVMNNASLVNAAGADFKLMGLKNSRVKTTKPLVTICATRTGCGKSQTTRTVVKALKEKGLKVASIRHPMPYGNLVEQKMLVGVDVRHHHFQQVIRILPGHQITLLYFREAGHPFLEVGEALRGVAVHADLDHHGQVQSQFAGIQYGFPFDDDAGGFQLLYPARAGRR